MVCHQSPCMQVARVTKPAPEFRATAVMPDGTFQEVALSDYKGKYVMLYFWPLDFTYVCPSEILAFDKIAADLKKMNVELLGCSVDSHFTHMAWRNTPREKGGIGHISHPMISDITKKISHSYGVLLEDQGIALRGLFLIDKEGVIRHMIMNDLPLGRSAEEAVRMVEALQFTEKHGEVCPANWKKGEKGMKPSAEGVAQYLAALPK